MLQLSFTDEYFKLLFTYISFFARIIRVELLRARVFFSLHLQA